VLIPQEKVFKLDNNIDFISAALTELLSCCVHGLVEETNISAGERVLISGPGPIGLLALQVAKIQGGEVIVCGIEKDYNRIQLAKDLGAKHIFIIPDKNFETEIMKLTDNYGVDVAVECSGSGSSLNNCINLLKRKGKLVHMGIFPEKVLYDVNQAIFKEIKIIPTFSHIQSSWELSLRLMSEGLIKTFPLVSHTFSIDDWEEAYKISKSHKGIKIIILPQL
jgi:L-iditol 2-dehydrogenase